MGDPATGWASLRSTAGRWNIKLHSLSRLLTPAGHHFPRKWLKWEGKGSHLRICSLLHTGINATKNRCCQQTGRQTQSGGPKLWSQKYTAVHYHIFPNFFTTWGKWRFSENGLLWGLNEMIHKRRFEQCLTYKELTKAGCNSYHILKWQAHNLCQWMKRKIWNDVEVIRTSTNHNYIKQN